MTPFLLTSFTLILLFSIVEAHGMRLTLMPTVGPVKTAGLNSNLAVTCVGSVHGHGTLQWLKKPDKVFYSNISRVHTRWYPFSPSTSSTTQGLSLFMNRIQASDSGVYVCRNMSSNDEVSFELIAHEPVQFKDTPLTQAGNEGEAMTVRCEAIGTPSPVIMWTGPDQKPLLPHKYEIGGDGLLIRNLTIEDAGLYQCKALQQAIDTFSTQTVDVHVLHKPLWLENDKGSVVFKKAASSAGLSCKARGDPPPAVQWYLNDQQISKDVQVLDVNSTGNYQCRVYNKLGEISRNFTVKEGRLPGRPRSVTPHNVTSNSFALDFTPPEHNPKHNITGYKVEVFSQKGNHRKHKAVPGADATVITITELLPNTLYVIRLRAENEVGVGDSLEVEARTSAASATSFASAFMFIFTIATLKGSLLFLS